MIFSENKPQCIRTNHNPWANDLERRVTCCTRLWDNFHQVWSSTTYRCLNYGVLWCWYFFTLWPWLLTSWPWTFTALRISCVQTLCKIWAK